MKIDFGEMLDSQRIRPLWGRSTSPQAAHDTLRQLVGGVHSAGGETANQPPEAAADATFQDLADVPIEPPHQLLDQLERVLRAEFGQRAAMIRPTLEALRARIHRLDPTAPAANLHPLRHATAGTVLQLINRLEDTLRGLRRVAGK